MLGKLMKHEWKAVAKILLVLHLALLAMAGVGRMLLSIEILKEKENLWGALLLVYMFSVFCVSVGSQIFLAVRFYKNMYTDEGYLTFTLPVKPWEHIFAKVSVASLWILIDIIVIIASILILVMNKEVMADFVPAWNEMVSEIRANNVMGVSEVILTIVVLLLSLVSVPLLYYVSISIGQLFHSHKLLASMVTYFIIANVIKIISAVGSSVYMLSSVDKLIATDGMGFYSDMLLASVIGLAIMCVGFWMVIQYIMSRRLNLE